MAVNQKLENTSNACSRSSHGPMIECSARYWSTFACVQAALRQQRPGNRGQRQQEQQHQRGAHRRQGAPRVAGQREQTQRCRDTPILGGICVCSRGGGGAHSGNRKSLTNASRTHEMNSFHRPVTSASPTRMSSTPPEDLDRPRVTAQPTQSPHGPRRAEGQEHERNSQPQAVGDHQHHAAGHGGAVAGRRHRDDGRQRRPEAWRPAQCEHRTEQRRTREAWTAGAARTAPRAATPERTR